jgi:hypothetical protein
MVTYWKMPMREIVLRFTFFFDFLFV